VTARAEVVVHRDAALLAKAAAARLITKLLDAQAARGSASVVLTGGGIGGATLRAVRESPIIDVVDWSQVDVFWGDERFVDRGSDERNERAAYEALLDHIDVDPDRVFPMGWAGGEDDDPVAAAERYARTLASRAPEGALVPRFDVLLLGLGPPGCRLPTGPSTPLTRSG
jgi:6-phosphogluconolactonase